MEDKVFVGSNMLNNIVSGKRVKFDLNDGHKVYAMVEGSLSGISEKTINLDCYRQTHLNNSLSMKPVETGEHKSFDRNEIALISPSDWEFQSVFTNAYYPSDIKGSSEWWYFLLFDESGKVMSGKLELQGTHDKLVGASDLSVYEKGKEPVFLVKNNIRDLEASQDKCSVRTGDDRFYEKDGKYHLYMRDENIALVLEGTPAKDDQTISINFPLNEYESVKWVVPSFNGTYEGELYQKGITTKVKGKFFHDHNRDDLKRTIKFMKNFKGWAWGIQYQGDDALLYARCFVKHFPLSLQLRKKDGQFDVVTDEQMLSMSKDFTSFEADFKGDKYNGDMGRLHTAPRFSNPLVEKVLNGFGLRKDYSHSSEEEEYFQVWRRVLFNKGF